MNIFYVDHDPVIAAQSLCDKHVVKMVLETAQLLCLAMPAEISPYRHTHKNHPCAKWVVESTSNWNWLCTHGLALAKEYTYRYGREHKSEAVIRRTAYYLESGRTPFTIPPQCMPDEYKVRDTVQAYRKYYREGKRGLLTYTRREPPSWVSDIATVK